MPDAACAQAANKPHIVVAAGMILRADGRVLLGQRPEGKSWAGWWELPGGKLEAGETAQQALIRELKEELDIHVTHASPWVRYRYAYEHVVAHLHLYRVTAWEGTPTGQENQALAWVNPGQMTLSPVLPATQAPLRWIQLPEHYVFTEIGDASYLPQFLQRLEHTLSAGRRYLVQFREPDWQKRAAYAPHVAKGLYQAFTQVLACCRSHHVPCLVNSVHPLYWWSQADGVHLRAQDARTWQGQPRPQGLMGVSTHDVDELQRAQDLGADFAVLGHVLRTPSHLGLAGMGWVAFARYAENAGLPVYALGGQRVESLATAQQHGAHGVAGMRQMHSLAH